MPDYYALYFLMILAMLFAGWAQINVKTTFSKYSRISNSAGMTGFDAARKILDANGLYNIRIEQVAGELTDHYDPKAGVIRLSADVYGSTSAAEVISRETGVTVYSLDMVMAGDSYFDAMYRNIDTIKEALG